MPRYRITRQYSSNYKGTRLHYQAGAEVDLPEDQADWLERDSPGLLVPAEPEPAGPVGEDTDGGSVDTDTSDADAAAEAGTDPESDPEEQEPPRRNRAHRPRRTRSSS